MTHPLTDEMCDSIAPWPIKRLPGEYVSMRVIADWQLEQVIDWIESTLTTGDVIAEDLKKAMRLQQND